MPSHEELLKKAHEFSDILNELPKETQDFFTFLMMEESLKEVVKINGCKHLIENTIRCCEGDNNNLLKESVGMYNDIIKGLGKDIEKEYLLFIKTVVEKMIEERR